MYIHNFQDTLQPWADPIDSVASVQKTLNRPFFPITKLAFKILKCRSFSAHFDR